MLSKIKARLASEQGFTLIELLVVIIILGILVAIAVPAYLSFRGNAQDAAAKSNVRSAIPAAEGFYQAGQTYTGMTLSSLQAEAPGVSGNVGVVVGTSGQSYCLDDVNEGNGHFVYIGGTVPAAALAAGTSGSVQAGDCATNYVASAG